MNTLKRTATAATALAVATLLASTASSQTFSSYANGNYDVDDVDNTCAMSSTFDFDGRLPINFMILFNGERVGFFLTSMDWSATHGQDYPDMSFLFFDPDESYDGAGTSGYVDGAKKGFLGVFGPEVLEDFAQSQRLVVARGEGEDLRIVADLNLAGSADAISALRRCATIVQRREAERLRREARWDHIDRDPFED